MDTMGTKNQSLLKYGPLAILLLCGAPAAAEQETVVVFHENYCWDNSADDNTFVCEEGDRVWGTATNIPHPPLEEEQPVTENYRTSHTITQADHTRCLNSAKDLPEYKDIIVEAWVSCSVNADWFAYPIAKGNVDAPFGDDLERGILRDSLREGGDPDKKWENIVAEVKAVGCNCFLRIPVGPL